MLLDPINDPPADLPNTVEAWHAWLSSIMAYTTARRRYKQDRAPTIGDGMVQEWEFEPFVDGSDKPRFYCAGRVEVEPDYDGTNYDNIWAAVKETILPGQAIPNNYRKQAT